MNDLSIKELRLRMPSVLRRLRRGERFRLVYRGRPAGHLTPTSDIVSTKNQGLYALLDQPFGEVRVPRGETAAGLIRKDRA